MGVALVKRVSQVTVKSNAVFEIQYAAKPFNQLTRWPEHFNFKSGYAIWVVRLIKTDCFIVFKVRIPSCISSYY